MPSLYIPTQVIIQLDNQIQPPQWGAPVLMQGANIVSDEHGGIVYQPAFSQRPMAADEFTDDNLAAINNQLAKLGVKMVKNGTTDSY